MGHIKSINLESGNAANKLLSKIINTPSIDKSKFKSVFLTQDMSSEFENLIISSTHTWSKMIFPNYLFTLPNRIEMCKNKTREYENKIENIKENIKKKNEISRKMKNYTEILRKTVNKDENFVENLPVHIQEQIEEMIEVYHKYENQLFHELEELITQAQYEKGNLTNSEK